MKRRLKSDLHSPPQVDFSSLLYTLWQSLSILTVSKVLSNYWLILILMASFCKYTQTNYKNSYSKLLLSLILNSSFIYISLFLFLPSSIIQLPILITKFTTISRMDYNGMDNFQDKDEALIQHFIGLQTSDELCPVVKTSQKDSSSTNWDLCLLSKVISDRTILEGPFTSAMLTTWGANPVTKVRPVS